MSIWSHRFVAESRDYLRSLPEQRCAYCSSPLIRWGWREPLEIPAANAWSEPAAAVCNQCGWWYTTFIVSESSSPNDLLWRYATAGQLRTLDTNDVTVPLAELRRYLMAKRDARFALNPRRFEDLVGGVFSDFGYRVRVTSYSGDKGIDVVVLDGPSDALIGVQVKRYKNPIEAEQIRAFVGALMLGGYPKGVFVTTSEFRSGAVDTAARSTALGLPLHLWDGKVFLERLGTSLRPAYTGVDDTSAPFHYYLRSPESMMLVDSTYYSGSAHGASSSELELYMTQATRARSGAAAT
ncbi:MAG: restriction endonuclease [Planctomycetota bacterium]